MTTFSVQEFRILNYSSSSSSHTHTCAGRHTHDGYDSRTVLINRRLTRTAELPRDPSGRRELIGTAAHHDKLIHFAKSNHQALTILLGHFEFKNPYWTSETSSAFNLTNCRS